MNRSIISLSKRKSGMSNRQKLDEKNPQATTTYEMVLACSDDYIKSQVNRYLSKYPSFAPREVKRLETDEITQRVRIKFWHMLERGTIRCPRAYVRSIICSEIIDMLRRKKATQPLPTGENEEYHGEFGCIADPEDEVLQQMEGESLLNEVIERVLELPPRQKLAMICQLQDQVDDLVELIDAFKQHRCDIEQIQWPAGKAEKQLLRASLSAARRNLARNIKKDNS
jgi:DNA-directed RNA polymerase specialized sigma24 family protein